MDIQSKRPFWCLRRIQPVMQFWFIILCLFSTGACLPLAQPPPLPTITPAPPSQTPTSTPVWFPPTPTNTAYPTATQGATQTPPSAPEHGSVIFTDDFSEPDPWVLIRTANTSVATSNHELTLATSKPKGYLYTIRQEPDLRDFYLEITASPSICQGGDEYGLILRFSDAGNLFRFALTCDGRARVDRILNNQPSSPQPLTYHGAIPPGAPSSSRMAVQAIGRHMHFYINDEYLYSISDPNLPAGKLGLFIRPAGEGSMTVNFSDLNVHRPLP
jgi:hypothetical protein